MKNFLKTIFIIFSFIFISCSNDVTKTGTGIDTKYRGQYSGDVTRKHKNGSNENGKASFTVNDDGSLKGSINYYGGYKYENVEISSGNINKISDNAYSAEINFVGFKKYTFIFKGSIMEIKIINEDDSITSGQLLKK